MTHDDLPVLALDVDGVILDYLSGLKAYVESLGHLPGCEVHEITDWEMSNFLPFMTVEERVATYSAFSTTAGFGALGAYEGAIEAIASIREEFPGLRVVAITSAGTHAETERLRRLNLEPFGIDDVTVLPLGGSKRDHLAALPPGSVFVDDLLKHVLTADEVGVTGIFFRRSYNVRDEHPRTVRDWEEARAAIVELLAPAHAPSGPRP